MVAVDGDRVTDLHGGRGLANVIEVFLEFELRCVHADHHQSLILVFPGPRADVWKLAPPVDAGIGPELDQDDFATQACRRQWFRI
jgi:hypothetical protein